MCAMNRVLVTGGAGFIGSHTVDLLLKNGYRVRVLDSLTPPVHHNRQLPEYFSPDAEFVHGDVRDKLAWQRALEDMDAVFHLAAYQDYLPDFSKFFHANSVSTALMYEVIVEGKLDIQKVVVASSQAAYGEGKYQCAEHGVQFPDPRPTEQLERKDWDPKCKMCQGPVSMLATDEVLVNPHNSYAMSKYTGERIAMMLGRRYMIPSVGMRYSIVQGSRQSFRNAYSGVLRIFAMQLLAGQRPTAYEDGQQMRDYVHVADVASANLLALEHNATDFQVFNVGGDQRVTVIEFARVMAEKLGRGHIDPILSGEYRFGDTRHIVSDVSKLRGLGWEPLGSVEQSIDDYLLWTKQQPDFTNYATEALETMRRVGTVRGGG